MCYAAGIRLDLVVVLVVGLWDRSICTRLIGSIVLGEMDDLFSVIILLRSWNDIPLPAGFRHQGRPWHVNPVAVIEDQRVWSNRNTDWIWIKLFYPMKKSMIGPPSPCRSALDVVASFTTPVDIVSSITCFCRMLWMIWLMCMWCM